MAGTYSLPLRVSHNVTAAGVIPKYLANADLLPLKAVNASEILIFGEVFIIMVNTLTTVNKNVNYCLIKLCEDIAMSLAIRIKEAMDEKGVKPPALARYLKKPPATVHGWLSGRVKFISYELLDRVADYLGVNPKWLNTGTGPKYPAQVSHGARIWADIVGNQNLPNDYYDYEQKLLYMCYDLVKEGLYGSDDDSKRKLYHYALDYARDHKYPPLKHVDDLLRHEAQVKKSCKK